MRLLPVTLLLSALTLPALSQTYLPARTGGLIVGDRSADQLWRLTDLNLDRDYVDPGEIIPFYTGANGPAMATVQDLAFDPDGTLYVIDSGPDSVLAIIDGNLDGDGDDAGESFVYFDNSNAAGIAFGSPMGLTVVDASPAPVVWIANSSNGAIPSDIVIRCQDLNGDDDAQDAGEATVYWDKALSQANGGPDLDIPAAIHVDAAGRVLLLHGAGSSSAAPRGLYHLADMNGDGDANDAGEVITYYTLPAATTPISFDITPSRNGDLYVVDSGAADTVYAIRDLNNDGVINMPGEETVYWSAGTTSSVNNMVEITEFDESISLLLAEDSSPDRILRLFDADMSGTIANATEQTDAYIDTAPGVLDIGAPRAVEAYPAPVLAGPPSVNLGATLTLTHTSVRGHTMGLAVAFGTPPLTIPPIGVWFLGFDPLVVLPFATVPPSGTFTIQGIVPNIPQLSGLTFNVQSGDVGAPTLLVSNLFPLNFN